MFRHIVAFINTVISKSVYVGNGDSSATCFRASKTIIDSS
jgi:hypothetical protein